MGVGSPRKEEAAPQVWASCLVKGSKLCEIPLPKLLLRVTGTQVKDRCKWKVRDPLMISWGNSPVWQWLFSASFPLHPHVLIDFILPGNHDGCEIGKQLLACAGDWSSKWEVLQSCSAPMLPFWAPSSPLPALRHLPSPPTLPSQPLPTQLSLLPLPLHLLLYSVSSPPNLCLQPSPSISPSWQNQLSF